ncbi:serine/threonine-protein kinase 11-interacting protein isoform X2 [Hetaerina americana]|uniref:serine/threonine-protein kinase 11-interacting protein isoform X2 n=1 Tax=Hetaerina americana TaxID=62018 RepID=UPI003A7F4050
MESSTFQATTMRDILRMATLLRDKGDRLLNFSAKLTLTLDFLIKLNEAFDMIVENVDTSHFQVINTNNSSIELIHDLQFLHDFVQKISGLRLWNRNKIPLSSVRIEKFRSLEYLELHGVTVMNIKLWCMRDKLKSLICTHCDLQDIKDLLAPEEDIEASDEDNWCLLKEVFLSFNDLKTLGRALMYAPRLKLLDLSHNCLTDISALSLCAEYLEYLNVSYNRLQSIPVISHGTKLKAIIASDNQLRDIEGLGRMPSLEHIDISNNLIINHCCLAPLAKLSRIEKLQLRGNPISFKRGHRLLTVEHLAPLVIISGKLLLDGHTLSSLEQSIYYERERFTAENLCISCSHSLYIEEVTNSGRQIIPGDGLVQQASSQEAGIPVGRKPVKVQEASIADEEECFLNESRDDNQGTATTSVVAGHLETKMNIETLRKNVGEENWLHGHGGQKVLNILGLSVKTAVAPTFLTSVADPSPSQPLVVEPSLDQVVQKSDGTMETACDKAKEVHVEVVDEYLADDEASQEEEEENAACVKEQEEKESGAELGVFLVQRGRVQKENSLQMDDLLLRVTDRLLIECNGAHGMEMARRTLSNLVAVSEEDVNDGDICRKSVRLSFRDSYHVEVLTYFMDDEESEEFLKLIQGMLATEHSNAVEPAVQFTCMRCSTTFAHSSFSSIENSSLRKEMEEDSIEKDSDATPKCPKCNSVAVVQNILEEASNFQETSDVPKVKNESILPSNVANQPAEPKDPIAQWADINVIDEVPASSEAVDHGLQLHILLNILPDGQGKDFDVQDVLIFQGNSGDAFCGHIVFSAGNIYVLKESEPPDSEERSPGDEHSEPTLVEQHSIESCLSAVKLLSGYLIKFEPAPISNLWVFPRHKKRMEKMMEELCSTLRDKQVLLDEDQRINMNNKLSEIIVFVPAAAITCLTGICGPLESSVDDAQYGILVLTSSVIFFVPHKEIEIFVSSSEYIPSNERRIADLVSLNGASRKFHQLRGIVLHFISEEHDDKFLVWPWGDGLLLDLLYHLQKPWEDIFSVPFETILGQTTGEEN